MRRSPRRWPWFILALIMGGMVVVLAGFVLIGLVRPPIDSANTFVAHLNDGEIVEAYNSLCLATRSGVTLEEFTEHHSAATSITDYTLASASSPFGSLTMVSGTVRLDGEPRNLTLHLVREQDQWRVCHYDPIRFETDLIGGD